MIAKIPCDLGKPRTSINRSTMRTYARNNNMELLALLFYI